MLIGQTASSCARRFRVERLVAALVAVQLAAVLPASAHSDKPLGHAQLQAGPYTVAVLFYTKALAGSDLRMLVVPQGPGSDGTDRVDVRVTARPGSGNQADAVVGRSAPDPEMPTATAVEQPLPSAGSWVLDFEFRGAAGPATARLPVTVASAGAIPVPVGWAIACIPLVGLAGFGLAQRRWLARAIERRRRDSLSADGAV